MMSGTQKKLKKYFLEWMMYKLFSFLSFKCSWVTILYHFQVNSIMIQYFYRLYTIDGCKTLTIFPVLHLTSLLLIYFITDICTSESAPGLVCSFPIPFFLVTNSLLSVSVRFFLYCYILFEYVKKKIVFFCRLGNCRVNYNWHNLGYYTLTFWAKQLKYVHFEKSLFCSFCCMLISRMEENELCHIQRWNNFMNSLRIKDKINF